MAEWFCCTGIGQGFDSENAKGEGVKEGGNLAKEPAPNSF